ncbi:MAG: hypothetical protein NW201_00395 [Gemmatimonadales bacterium]|nr:hypothetical protein [Gemmatimonadales bacterium]
MIRGRPVARALLLLALGFAGGVAFAEPPWRPWYEADAQDWARMTSGERDLFVLGFLAGSGVADAERAGATDSLSYLRAFQQLRRGLDGRTLRYPFAPHLYTTRFGDRFFWENYKREPLWWSMVQVNEELKAPMANEGNRGDLERQADSARRAFEAAERRARP